MKTDPATHLGAPGAATAAQSDSIANSTSEPLPSTCLDTNLSYLDLSRPISTEKVFPFGTQPGSHTPFSCPFAAPKQAAVPKNPQLTAPNHSYPQLTAANRSSRFSGPPSFPKTDPRQCIADSQLFALNRSYSQLFAANRSSCFSPRRPKCIPPAQMDRGAGSQISTLLPPRHRVRSRRHANSTKLDLNSTKFD